MIPCGIMIEPGSVPVTLNEETHMKIGSFIAAMAMALVVILVPAKGCQLGPPESENPTPVEAPFETE